MTQLAKFRDDLKVAGDNPKVPQMGKAPYIFQGRMVVFDQALTNTGWAWLQVTERGLSVVATGLIHTEGVTKGYRDTFARGTDIFTEVLGVLEMAKPHMVIHEMPNVGIPSRSNNKETGIVAAMAVRCATKQYGAKIEMVQNQHMKKELTGDAKADKRRVQEAVRAELPGLPESSHRLNEHIYDAVALGIIAAREYKT